jgi:hypothetical protein
VDRSCYLKNFVPVAASHATASSGVNTYLVYGSWCDPTHPRAGFTNDAPTFASSSKVPSAQNCSQLCGATINCVAWVWQSTTSTCFMKASTGNHPLDATCVTSQTILGDGIYRYLASDAALALRLLDENQKLLAYIDSYRSAIRNL